ncbi:Mss4-like protein [Fomitopsis serialis]|uniref:Mss4-like protein n=1 Tax=Fomitopsis serialis TaxID=139415 RepID=UPI0020076E2B|nr:Mss4-like protein [Neoantrodia serialis]KAH9938637.1 Mss4-like protein [Neoantrodia serialis]
MSDVEGSCACGAITLRVVDGFGENAKAVICHCTDCQKAAGSLCSYWAPVLIEKLKIVKGQPKTYRSPEGRSMSGKPVQRIFCGDCGTPLYAYPEGSVSGKFCVLLALFDNNLELGVEIFWRSAKGEIPPFDRRNVQDAISLFQHGKAACTI